MLLQYKTYIIYAVFLTALFLLSFLIGRRIRKIFTPKKKIFTPKKKTDRKARPQKKKSTKTPAMADVDAMPGHEFEYFCADLLRKNGFRKVKVTARSGDQGVDIIAVKGTSRYAIQCKRYASPLGNKPVQEVYTGKAFYNCKYGVVMTNSIFTPHAKELAKKTGVLLWDRRVIGELMRGERKSI